MKKNSGCHIGEVYIYLETELEAVSDIKPSVDAPPLISGKNSGVLKIANDEQQEEKKNLVYFIFVRIVIDRIHSEKKRNLFRGLC